MNPNFKEGLTYLDWAKRRVIVHYRCDGIMVVRLVFNFQKGVPDELDEALKFFMRFQNHTEETEYLNDKRKEVWEKLCRVRQR